VISTKRIRSLSA